MLVLQFTLGDLGELRLGLGLLGCGSFFILPNLLDRPAPLAVRFQHVRGHALGH